MTIGEGTLESESPSTPPSSTAPGPTLSPTPRVLASNAPSARDKYFLKAQWEALAKGPDVLRQGGMRLLSLATGLSAVYLAVLGLGDLAKDLDTQLRIVMLVPYLPWLAAMMLAHQATVVTIADVATDAPDEVRRALTQEIRSRAKLLESADVALVFGVGLMVICLFLAFTATP